MPAWIAIKIIAHALRPRRPPLPADIQQAIDAIMRGNPPLVLFTTLARDHRLFFKFFNSGLLDRGHLTIRQREIVIDRVTAACGAEYEWGVHVSTFAAKAGLSEEQIASLTNGGATGCVLGRRGSRPDPALRQPALRLHRRRRAVGAVERAPQRRGHHRVTHAGRNLQNRKLSRECAASATGSRRPQHFRHSRNGAPLNHSDRRPVS